MVVEEKTFSANQNQELPMVAMLFPRFVEDTTNIIPAKFAPSWLNSVRIDDKKSSDRQMDNGDKVISIAQMIL